MVGARNRDASLIEVVQVMCPKLLPALVLMAGLDKECNTLSGRVADLKFGETC